MSKKKDCNNCIYKVDGKCTNNDYLFKGDNSNRPYCKWHLDHKQTNAERIRNMTNEELANFIFLAIEDTEWDEDGNNNYEDDWLEWLDEEVDK